MYLNKLLCLIDHIIDINISRSAYPFSTPGAFIPHSAINLSVKGVDQPSPPLQSLDLSVTEAGAIPTSRTDFLR